MDEASTREQSDKVKSKRCNGQRTEAAAKLIESLGEAFSAAKDVNSQDILDILDKFEFKSEDWAPFIHFNKNRYMRNLVHLDERYSLFILCWEKGQESPIHDHAASICWVKVLEGNLQQVYYNNYKKPFKKSKMLANHSYHFNENVGLHTMGNASNERAISLHLYAPPYIECANDSTVVPVCYCNVLDRKKREQQEKLQLQLKSQRGVFSNFQTLTELLRAEIGPNPDIPKVKKIIESFQLNPKEFHQYCKWDNSHYTRNLVAYDEHFTLLLIGWDCGQCSPIHDHAGSSCWVKVLEGELTEILYKLDKDNRPKEVSCSTLMPDSVAYIDDTIGVHLMGNTSSDTRTITLHCYAPPYQQCNKYDLKSGAKEKVSMAVVNQLVLQTAPPGAPSGLLTSVEQLVTSLLQQFQAAAPHPPKSTHIKDILQAFVFDPSEWQLYAHFDKHRYTRNLLAFNEYFSLIMICWNVGQASPVHDHKQSSCWLKVVDGELKLTLMDRQHKPTKVSRMLTSSVQYFDENIGLHVTENSTSNTCISLHLYSPPYFECTSGTTIIPVVYCSSMTCCDKGKDVPTLVDLLRQEFYKKDDKTQLHSRIKRVLESLQFHPKELQQYLCFNQQHYTRTPIAYDEQFNVFLLCWNPEQQSPIHDHSGSCSWMKVLDGEIEEVQYSCNKAPVVTQTSTFLQDSVIFNDESVVHQIRNTKSGGHSVTLHIYSPPYAECNCFDPCCGQKHTVALDDLASHHDTKH